MNLLFITEQWVVIDFDHIKVGTIEVYGTLEFDHLPDANGIVKDFLFEASYIFIRGGRMLAGYSGAIYTGQLDILLHGTTSSPDFPRTSGPLIGAKVLGIPRVCYCQV